MSLENLSTIVNNVLEKMRLARAVSLPLCNDCKIEVEWGGDPYMEYYICPKCGRLYVEEAERKRIQDLNTNRRDNKEEIRSSQANESNTE